MLKNPGINKMVLVGLWREARWKGNMCCSGWWDSYSKSSIVDQTTPQVSGSAHFHAIYLMRICLVLLKVRMKVKRNLIVLITWYIFTVSISELGFLFRFRQLPSLSFIRCASKIGHNNSQEMKSSEIKILACMNNCLCFI